MKKKAVILFSGGLDSTTCLAIAKYQDFDCYALSFNYGQKHSFELKRAKRIAKKYGILNHKIVDLDLEQFGGSSLTDSKLKVPSYKNKQKKASNENIPSTYVPARNTIFLSIALAWAETLGAQHIFIGVNHLDYSGYPDCRPQYLRAFEKLAALATKKGVGGKKFKIHAPLLKLNKAEIIELGTYLNVDYSETFSCYRPTLKGLACGTCDSCTFRKNGFKEAKIQDPTPYA